MAMQWFCVELPNPLRGCGIEGGARVLAGTCERGLYFFVWAAGALRAAR